MNQITGTSKTPKNNHNLPNLKKPKLKYTSGNSKILNRIKMYLKTFIINNITLELMDNSTIP